MTKFARYAWGVLGFNILVILWGAYVRATGSGAGCGSHWPLCNGEVIPRAPQVETIIEFIHRMTSGGAFLLVVGLVVAAWRVYPKSQAVRKGAASSMVFMVLEALVGAALVLLELVADNQSIGRVIFISLHLINTFLLLACLALTAWWASGGVPVRFSANSWLYGLFGLGLLGVILVGISGAITALGDTLFPSSSLAEGIRLELSPTSHFLVRLRVLHPVIAVVVGLFTVFVSILVALEKPERSIRTLAWMLVGLFTAQLAVGLVNVLLLAPIPMQLTHLLLADFVWITFVLLAAATFRRPVEGTIKV